MGTKINKDQEKCGRYIKVSEKKKEKERAKKMLLKIFIVDKFMQ